MVDLKDYADNSIIKSLLANDFSEEYICAAIERGDIKIEKSKVEKPVEEEDKTEKCDTSKIEKGDECPCEKEEDNKEKPEEKEEETVEEEVITKSFANEIFKSLEEKYSSRLETIEKSLEELNKSLGMIKNSAPEFKSVFPTGAIINKSVEIVDGKIELRKNDQRAAIRNVISKAIDLEKDPVLKSTLSTAAVDYFCDINAEIPTELETYMATKGYKFI